MTVHNIPPAHRVAETLNVLAPALSDGRRRLGRLSFGPNRGFSTDLQTVYVPYPPDELGLRYITCGAVLQASPTKELVAELAVDRLSKGELKALCWVEGEAAFGWVLRRWPGLATDLVRLLPGVVAGDPNLDALDLRRAMSAEKIHRGRGAPPALFGRLEDMGAPPRARRSPKAATRRLMVHRTRVRGSLIRLPVASPDAPADRPGAAPAGADTDTQEIPLERPVGLPYPEWDVHSNRYREDFVTVLERYVPSPQGPVVVPPEVLHWFRRSPERAWHRRLDDGTELDLDAFIDQHTRVAVGEASDGRVYATLGEGARDVATAVLLDASSSLHSSGDRRFALEMSCADALASAMAEGREPHAIFAFTGETRRRVEIKVLRRFGDRGPSLPSAAKLRPNGYTRLGAALRHVTRRLLETPASRRVLLSIGDGLPSDEGYEGEYAEADVAKAVEEATAEGVVVFHIGVGGIQADPLPGMFGPGRCLRVKRSQDLASALAAVYEELCDQ